MDLSEVNNWDTYERDFETLQFSIVDQEGKEIIKMIVAQCVTVFGISLFFPFFPIYPLVAGAGILSAGACQGTARAGG